MREKTDLNAVKSVATSLLLTEVHKTEFSPAIVQHSFTATGLIGIDEGGKVQLIDITQSNDNLRKWQDHMRKLIEKADDIQDIYHMVNKPYVLTFLKFTKHHLSQKDLSNLLSDAWIRSENPNCDANVNVEELVSMFKKAEKVHLMNPDEITELNELNDNITIYRGVTSFNSQNLRTLSWTLDPHIAEWFATRFGEEGTVYKATIQKEHILALFNRRNESEIIVEPKHLQEISEYEGIDEGLSMQ